MKKDRLLPKIQISKCDSCSKLITVQDGVWRCQDGGYMGIYTKSAIQSCGKYKGKTP